MTSSGHPAQTQPADKVPPLAWLLLVLSLLWSVLWFVHALGYWEDDAYIHLEFARSLAAGRGFSFNGHVVYGDTSPLWAWLLVAFHRAIPNWMTAGKTLTAVAAVFALTGAFAFARSLTRTTLSAAASNTFAALMMLIFVTNPYFGYWAFSGMEALAAAGLVCWGAVAIAPPQLPPKRFLAASLVAGLAPLLRPEMAFFSLLLSIVLLFRLYRSPAPLGRRIALLLAGLVLATAPFLLWIRYAVRTFGSVLPNTNGAKRAGPGDSVLFHLIKIYAVGFPLLLCCVLLLAAWALWYLLRARRNAPPRPLLPTSCLLLLLWTFLDCVFYIADHTYVQTRYIFVTAPVLTIALLALAAPSWPRIYRSLAAFGLLFGVTLSLFTTWPLIRNKIIVDRDYAQLAGFLRALPADAPVAHYSIGEAAFLSEHPLVDTGGITRPGIIPLLNDPTDDRRVAWMRSEGAKYIIIDHQPVPDAQLVWSREIPAAGWFLNPRLYAGTARLQVWTLPPLTTTPSGSPREGSK